MATLSFLTTVSVVPVFVHDVNWLVIVWGHECMVGDVLRDRRLWQQNSHGQSHFKRAQWHREGSNVEQMSD